MRFREESLFVPYQEKEKESLCIDLVIMMERKPYVSSLPLGAVLKKAYKNTRRGDSLSWIVSHKVSMKNWMDIVVWLQMLLGWQRLNPFIE